MYPVKMLSPNPNILTITTSSHRKVLELVADLLKVGTVHILFLNLQINFRHHVILSLSNSCYKKFSFVFIWSISLLYFMDRLLVPIWVNSLGYTKDLAGFPVSLLGDIHCTLYSSNAVTLCCTGNGFRLLEKYYIFFNLFIQHVLRGCNPTEIEMYHTHILILSHLYALLFTESAPKMWRIRYLDLRLWHPFNSIHSIPLLAVPCLTSLIVFLTSILLQFPQVCSFLHPNPHVFYRLEPCYRKCWGCCITI